MKSGKLYYLLKSAGMLLFLFNGTHTHTIFVHIPRLYVPHFCCRTTQPLQTHTHISKTCCFYVSECASYLLLNTASRYRLLFLRGTHHHSVITAATGGLLSEKPSLSRCFSQLAPPPALLQHPFPSPLHSAICTVQRAREGRCKSAKSCVPIAETAGSRSSMGGRTQAAN